jgi:glycosyltransferase EpsE
MIKRKKPLISIVMPVRNASLFLMEAVESIRNQTYNNWELIAVDDCSFDDSYEILRRFSKRDKRIKLFRNKKCLGVSATANFALKRAKGNFIARMDADDVSFPDRLEKQLIYLQKNKKVVVIGGQCDLIDGRGIKMGEKVFPIRTKDIKKMIFSSIPLQQPTLMVNCHLLPSDFQWYDSKQKVAEEVDLLFRFFQYGQVHNLKDKVLFYRIHGENTSLKNPKKTFFLTLKTRIKAIFKYGYRPTLQGIFITFMQAILISLLPERLIYPLYAFLRNKRIGKKVYLKPQLAGVKV